MITRSAVFSLVVAGVMLRATDAQAAGFYFSERGVRPLARGGAFTAGADDLGAMWHNPAGIYEAGTEFLFDASWLHFTTEYQRRAILEQRDPNTGAVVGTYEQTYDEVRGTSPVIPIPTIAGSYQVHDRVVVALGVHAPYAAVTSFPESHNGAPSPQRYALITLDGSALVYMGAYAAFKAREDLRIGIGFEVLAGRFRATQMFSGCVPEKFFCAPEQPEWDTLTQLTAGPIIAPTGVVGVIYNPHEQWRIGANFHGPTVVRAPAEIAARLPATPVFETARQEGREARVAFELPYSLRLGVEFRPVPELRIEATGAFEAWSMHDAITITPENVELRNVVGFPDPYRVPTQTIPRNFRDTGSARLGSELDFELFDLTWTGRGGVSYESSAIPDQYTSALTIDMSKVTVGLGLGLHVDAWRFDVTYAHVFGTTVDVPPDQARVPLLSPVAANQAEPHYINGGTYRARSNVLGLGFRYDFDHVDEPAPDGPSAASVPVPLP